MPKTFRLESNLDVCVEHIRGAFATQEYWRDRLALSDMGSATLEGLSTGDDGTLAVSTRISMAGERLPRVVRRLGLDDLVMIHEETWSPVRDGAVRGEVKASVGGTSLAARGHLMLAPTGAGSRLTGSATVSSTIPVAGGAVESFLGGHLVKEFERMQTFTSTWVSERRRCAGGASPLDVP